MTFLWDLSTYVEDLSWQSQPRPSRYGPTPEQPELIAKSFTCRPHPCFRYGGFLGPFGSISNAVAMSRGNRTAIHIVDLQLGLSSATWEFPAWRMPNLPTPQHCVVDPFCPDTYVWTSTDFESIHMFDLRTLATGPVMRIGMFLLCFPHLTPS